jgi:hypothetical protein
MRLDAYQVQPFCPEMVPGNINRSWMDDVPGRHPYRCLPLNMANSTGWELRLSHGFDAHWNGGNAASDLVVTPHDPNAPMAHVANSHFAFGILTFHTGYLFRTPAGWHTWAMGCPNLVKDGIQPLNGLIETDWLPYPFTMNWKFTRPGTVTFSQGEPFCFITLMRSKVLEDIEPKLHRIEDNPKLLDEYEQWKEARSNFNQSMAAGDPQALKEAWQRYYMRGLKPDGSKAPKGFTNKRRLKAPEKD